jgi:uncharacterized protein DUF5996
MSDSPFPDLSDSAWQRTCETLQVYANVLGAIRGALTPRQKHWWHTPLSVSAAGLTTTPIAVGDRVVEIILSFIDHRLFILSNSGQRQEFSLQAHSEKEFTDTLFAALSGLGVTGPIERRNFSSVTPRTYDPAAVARFWEALPVVDAVLKSLKREHRGESGPVVLWPHGFDLAVLLFSGRRIPGADPNNEEAADEQMNFGFAPGDSGIAEPYFYATAFPTPAGFVDSPLPEGASWNTQGWNGAALRYSVLRTMDKPTERLLEFFRAARDAGFARMK